MPQDTGVPLSGSGHSASPEPVVSALRASVPNAVEITIETTFRDKLAETLLSEARRLRREPATLMADIIEAVLGERTVSNLIGPVLYAEALQVLGRAPTRSNALMKTALKAATVDARSGRTGA